MTDQFYHRLQTRLNQRREENRLREVRTRPDHRLNLASNDYFQLSRHPRVIAAAREAAARYGTGSGASPLLFGWLPCHDELLNKLLSWKKKPAGILFNTGFMANQAVLKHLPGENDMVLADRLIHHSIAQALLPGPARFQRYRHLDLNHLEELLKKHREKHENLFVVTESVFSMDGDSPDLRGLADLQTRIPFIWVLDEAHGTGVFGETGAGLAEECGVADRVDILIGTLGKALGSMGAYVLARSREVTDTLINFAGEFIYSTFMSPPQAGAASAAIGIVRESSEPRRSLKRMAQNFRLRLREEGWEAMTGESPIVPVMVGEVATVMKIQDRFMDRGILVAAVRPPTVPPGTSRLRFSLHSGLTQNALEEIVDLLEDFRS